MRLPFVVVPVPSITISDRIVVSTDFYGVVTVSARQRPWVVAMSREAPGLVSIPTRVAVVIEPYRWPFVMARKPWPLTVDTSVTPAFAGEVMISQDFFPVLCLGNTGNRPGQSECE